MIGRRTFLATGAAMLASPVLSQTTGIGDLVGTVVRETGFNGVIAVRTPGQAALTQAFGPAEVETGRAATPDDRFAIGSISKWLTVTAALRLVEQGRLDLDAPITAVLRDYRADTGARLTPRRLLTNTSGVPNLWNDAVRADPGLLRAGLSTAEAVRRFGSGDLLFTPGERFDYIVTNWILVVAILETITGETFDAALHRLVLDPLGLTRTGLIAAEFMDASDAARGYASLNPPVRKMDWRPAFTAASGGLYSTVDDLLKAATGILETDFLTAASRAEMLKIQVPEQHYALGGRVRSLTIDGRTYEAAWETGRVEGYRSVLAHRLDGGGSVVLLNNTDMSQRVMDETAVRLFGAEPWT